MTPDYIALSAVLAWKFPDVTGIVTYKDELVVWPFETMPTEEDLDTWREEYIAAEAWESAADQ